MTREEMRITAAVTYVLGGISTAIAVGLDYVAHNGWYTVAWFSLAAFAYFIIKLREAA